MAADPINLNKLKERREAYGRTTSTTDETTERLLPHDDLAEKAGLGAIIIDNDVYKQAREHLYLEATDFRDQAHREIYAAWAARIERAGVCDSILLCDELSRRGTLEMVGGAAYVMGLGNAVPSSAHGLHYLRIVKDKADLRRLVDASGNIAGIGYTEGDPDKAIAESRAIIDVVYEQRALTANADEFPILTAAEAMEVQPALGMLGDILYENTTAVLYGPSQRWKSFVALSWALSISRAQPWFGRPVRGGGDVLYIAAEGGAGIPKRMKAWCLHHGLDPMTDLPNFHPMLVPLHLLDNAAVERFIQKVKRTLPEPPKLIVIDTLARSMPGAEDGTKDGSRAYDNADKLRRAFGCCVLMVAHPGKDATKGIRGWSGWFQSADVVIRVASEDDRPRLQLGDTVRLINEKPKDADEFDPIAFTAQLERWATDDGQIMSSLVVVAAEDPAAPPATPQLSDKAVKSLHALADLGGDAAYADWHTKAYDAYQVPKPTWDKQRRDLAQKGYVEQDTDTKHYTLTDLGQATIGRGIAGIKQVSRYQGYQVSEVSHPYRGDTSIPPSGTDTGDGRVQFADDDDGEVTP